jgi:adenine C2-methylase RlmN of 23S rRNA A2503 and tRNA A37
MGEPLHNIDNVIKAADIMVHDQGLHFSPRKVTVSTSGLVPQLRRFLHESNCALAVSLNATTDEVFSFNFSLIYGTCACSQKNYSLTR